MVMSSEKFLPDHPASINPCIPSIANGDSITSLNDTRKRFSMNVTARRLFPVLTVALVVNWSTGLCDEKPPEEKKIELWKGKAPNGDGQFEAAETRITFHPAPKPNGAALVICPGGGYGGLVTGAEGHGIAAWLNQHGIGGVVLEYRLPKGRPFVPLLDAQRAIRTVRASAKEWGLKSDRIGIIGFSAGGHLASTAATHFDEGNASASDPIDRVSCRPDFAILVYPVITMGDKVHSGSKMNLLGKDPSAKLIELFSNEKQVTAKTCPTFLAHAKDDTVVVPENSQMFYEACKAHNVPAEYLELPSGGHGLNGYKGPMWDAWQQKSLEWLNKLWRVE
jgi:acetyl esterase/lipase